MVACAHTVGYGRVSSQSWQWAHAYCLGGPRWVAANRRRFTTAGHAQASTLPASNASFVRVKDG